MGQFQQNLAKNTLMCEGLFNFEKGDNGGFLSLNQWFSHSFGQICLLI